jgi:hypothetical protein
MTDIEKYMNHYGFSHDQFLDVLRVYLDRYNDVFFASFNNTNCFEGLRFTRLGFRND